MRRSRRRRVLREDAVAPVLVMGVMLGVWWMGARVVSELRDPIDSVAATRIPHSAATSPPSISAAPPEPSDRERAGVPAPSIDPSVSAPPAPLESAAEAGVSGPTEASPIVNTAAAPNVAVTPEDVDLLRARRLRVPVDGIDPDTLTSGFHQRRGDGTHEAMDIMAPRGTRVRAVEGGRIAKLFTSKRGGITIYQFDPSESYCYYYAHLDGYASSLTEGAMVTAGDVIGFVGSTGNASPDAPHLHFAVFKLGPDRRWWQGLPIDPYLVLR
jgi:murein DD-endopeptidase MepM/ murein hydrolase activator NlpD